MTRAHALLTAAAVLFAAPLRADGDGFRPLFNGKDTAGWEVRAHGKNEPGEWFVKDGVLTAKPGSGWLGTAEKFGDFVLKVEWRVFEGGNSGVFLRVPDVESKMSPSYLGFEVQVLDDTAAKYAKLKPNQYAGSIYHFAPASKKVFKGVGEWNTFEITAKGDRVTVVFNDEKVSEVDTTSYPESANRPRVGRIGLQNHGTAVEYRSVRIKPLAP
jgi:hypothetical protein